MYIVITICICENVCRCKQRYMLIHLVLTTRKPPLRYCNISLGAFSFTFSLYSRGNGFLINLYSALPPDTFSTCPVSILACVLARNKMVSAMSSG